jgi:hypothetical protein
MSLQSEKWYKSWFLEKKFITTYFDQVHFFLVWDICHLKMQLIYFSSVVSVQN